ncbi:hypothetical protein B0T26DRAFT_714180 [Lasiosphaeria miniovina]|uniref:Uncharacterized protein n=1 Tax=Lasiosphaeria miniovina TaxID=1954250 RepID=A0AA40AAQ0_9PEZI|nr:uncharacterized protein B0T26DRAFT_714180 [Lasiosphaeria miniovina]KAK0712396.1 hypothetical protein B0T26DRAFT_714180 [Lasiosphaeria miniovina]
MAMSLTDNPVRSGQHAVYGRPGSGRSSTSSLSDNNDLAITPCPVDSSAAPHAAQQWRTRPAGAPQGQARTTPPPSWRNSLAASSLDGLDGGEPPDAGNNGDGVDSRTLWRRMLAIQRMFGCYNSARMRAALDAGVDDERLIPSRTCLDLLNDSIDQLPEESKRELERFLENEGEAASQGTKRGWIQRLLHSPTTLRH